MFITMVSISIALFCSLSWHQWYYFLISITSMILFLFITTTIMVTMSLLQQWYQHKWFCSLPWHQWYCCVHYNQINDIFSIYFHNIKDTVLFIIMTSMSLFLSLPWPWFYLFPLPLISSVNDMTSFATICSTITLRG